MKTCIIIFIIVWHTYISYKFSCSNSIIRSTEVSKPYPDTRVLLSSSCKWCCPACWAEKKWDWEGKIREVISCHRFLNFWAYILGSCFAIWSQFSAIASFLVRDAEGCLFIWGIYWLSGPSWSVSLKVLQLRNAVSLMLLTILWPRSFSLFFADSPFLVSMLRFIVSNTWKPLSFHLVRQWLYVRLCEFCDVSRLSHRRVNWVCQWLVLVAFFLSWFFFCNFNHSRLHLFFSWGLESINPLRIDEGVKFGLLPVKNIKSVACVLSILYSSCIHY